ncbi:MAG TPA: PAS domain S-box protein [Opitutaceae bacterium]|nr:PAS domain S-box protein [Opitutaceae bacterium]
MWLLLHLLQPPVKRPAWLRVLVTAGSVVLAFALRTILDPVLQWQSPFALLLPAILVSAWIGGARAGLTVTVAGGVGAVYVFVVPASLMLTEVVDLVAFFIFLLEGTLVSAICELLHLAVARSRASATEAARKFEIMANNAPVLIWSTDTLGRCVFVNRNWLTFTGRTWDEELSAGWLTNLHPEDLADYRHGYAAAAAEKRPYQFEYRLRRADGTYRWLLEHAVPRYDGDGQFEGFIGSCTDVTDSRREREELAFVAALQKSLAASLDLERVADALAAAAVPRLADWFCLELVHDDGRMETLSLHHAGSEAAPAAGAPPTLGAARAVVEAGEVQFTPRVDAAFLQACAVDDAHRRRLEGLGLVSHLGVPLRVRGKITGVLTLATAESARRLGYEEVALVQKIAGIAGFAIDNARLYRRTRRALAAAETARRQTAESERALDRQRGLLKTIIDSVPALVAYVGRDGRLLLHNQMFEEWLGPGHGDLIGRPLADIGRNGTGSPFTTHLAAALGGEGASYEDVFHSAGSERQVAAALRPDIDALARVRGVVFHAYDITDRKRAYAELATARELLRCHADELEARVRERTATLREANVELEAFTYSVSHDLRTPLQFVRSFAEAIEADRGNHLTAEGSDFLQRIIRAASRMEAIIHDLLGYSRLARADMALIPVPLQQVVADVVSHQQAGIQRCGARIEVDAPLPTVLADRVGLYQTLSNLVSNALKFSAAGRPPTVHVRAEDRGPVVRLWIEDNGIGIHPRHHEKIFQLFERLHSPTEYPGTGVGLALVRKAVQRMGGQCGVESAPGAGSRFWIDFNPAPAPAFDRAAAPAGMGEFPTGGSRIAV